MRQGAEASSLDVPGTRPWHLKLSVTQNPDDLAQRQETTVEEWWAGPNLWRRVYTTPTGSVTSLHTEGGMFRSKGKEPLPPSIGLLLEQIVHPLPATDALEKLQLESRPETLLGIAMDCISATRLPDAVPGRPVAHSFSPAASVYCFQGGKPILRLTRLSWHLDIVGSTMGRFQDRTVPTALLEQGPWGKIEAKVVQLETVSLTATDFPVGDDLEKTNERIGPGGGVMAGRKVKGSSPVYPMQAKMGHISGTVMLYAVIGTDGKIGLLQPISSPSPILTRAATEAVSRWEYVPYLIDGKPVEVETEITVSFNTGG